MNEGQTIYDQQAQLWNGPSGEAWVAARETLDGMFRAMGALLLEAVPAGAATRVLDVGCGTGATTRAIARRLGPQGRAVGLDLSAPMIAAARARAEEEGVTADFVVADAERHGFEPAGFDLVVSRLGVMFFGDPVRAFANLRRAAAPGAGLRFVAWRGAADNPFMTTAERAAAPLLPDLPARPPESSKAWGPGQFAFADRMRVGGILAESGWRDVEIRPVELPCSLPEAELVPYLGRLGPVGQALRDADEATRARVLEKVRAAFEPFVEGSEVRFTAACWLVTARAPAAAAEELPHA